MQVSDPCIVGAPSAQPAFTPVAQVADAPSVVQVSDGPEAQMPDALQCARNG